MKLDRGSLVVASETPTSVETTYGDISIAAKSLVLLMSTPNSIAVYNLDDHHRIRFRSQGGASFQQVMRPRVAAYNGVN